MKLSLNWLKNYVDFKVSPAKLAEMLTLSGTAVESIKYQKDQYQKIIIAKILEVKPHRNADKLNLAVVDTGFDKRQIVCGASNIKPGQLVLLALPGAVLSKEKNLKIKVCKIRGEKSQGMLCSAKELGFGTDHSGIFILKENFKPGQSLTSAFNLDDVILDLDLTPNRADCYSVLGIAREVAALTGQKLKKDPKKIKLKKISPKKSDLQVKILNKDLCFKYCALVIKNVKVGESPLWLKNYLLAAQIRPINNIVDITNFVMLDMGEPLHAFDFDNLGNQIVVRSAKSGESIKTLDQKNQKLDPSVLVIADQKKPVAIAGIMGGARTEVQPGTKNIVLEAAIFKPSSIRNTYRFLGMRTEAAIRFEKGIDWFLPEQALNKALNMVLKLAKGKNSACIVKKTKRFKQTKSFTISLGYINNLLGYNFTFKRVKEILTGLGIKVLRQSKDKFKVTPPSWRLDLAIPADIAEEVGRIFDYNKITPKPIYSSLESNNLENFFDFKNRIRKLFCSFGYNEIYTRSFYGIKKKKYISKEHVVLLNPVAKTEKYLRASLLPNILEKASKNLRFFEEIKMFEIGTVFLAKRQGLPSEKKYFVAVYSNKDESREIYYSLKGALELLLDNLGYLKDFLCKRINSNKVKVFYDNQEIGKIILLDQKQRKYYKIRQDLAVLAINLDQLFQLNREQKFYTPIPEFPEIVRDFSFFAPKNLKYQKLVQEIKKQSHYIQKVYLLDEYFIADAKRSLTVRLVFRSEQKTLKSQEVQPIEKKILKNLEKKLEVKLRK